jgi:hypothetical protein
MQRSSGSSGVCHPNIFLVRFTISKSQAQVYAKFVMTDSVNIIFFTILKVQLWERKAMMKKRAAGGAPSLPILKQRGRSVMVRMMRTEVE